MNGPMSAVIPDVVEQEVDNYRRTSFKLEKTFADVPAPKKIASKVKTKGSSRSDLLTCLSLYCQFVEIKIKILIAKIKISIFIANFVFQDCIISSVRMVNLRKTTEEAGFLVGCPS